MDAGHGIDKRLAFLPGVWIVSMHVLEKLPGIVTDHP